MSVATSIKSFFSALGKDLGVIGTDALKDIGVISKDVSIYAPLVVSTVEALFPGVALPVAAAQKIITSSLSTASTVASALQAEGLNPTLNQAAAIAIATQAHVSGATQAAVTVAVASATAIATTAAGVAAPAAS